MRARFWLAWVIVLGSIGPGAGAAEPAPAPVVVASKAFTESYVLAEIMAQLLERHGVAVERRLGLGSTMICYEALRQGEIDVYPEYSGTLGRAVLGLDKVPSLDELRTRLGAAGLTVLEPLGFNNTYAIAVPAALARSRGLERIGDLAGMADLRLALSHEFVRRDDGWPGLAKTYGLHASPKGIEHGLAYQALAEGRVDVIDAYSTDGEILRYDLKLLADDKGYFPKYLALPLVREDFPDDLRQALARLGGTIDEARMQAMNARVAIEKQTFAKVAGEFLDELEGTATGASTAADGMWAELLRNTLVHLQITGIALGAACLLGLPLGVLIYRSRGVSQAVLYVAGLLQTIPSIALLALMIPIFGIGVVPAVVALFLYSLLPILRSTITAMLTTDPLLRRVAVAMGLSRWQQIRYVLLPLALPNVFTGVRTAAVISIGTATLAAFIGAGGLGQPVVTGLALNDPEMILRGAIPAALLAMLTELLLERLERYLVPEHMVRSNIGS